MTFNALADRPDDFDGDECDWADHRSGPGPGPDQGDFDIEVATDSRTGRLICIYTMGLWWYGIPELYIELPAAYLEVDEVDQGRLALFLATGLMHLGQGLLATDELELPPYTSDFDDRWVGIWLERQEMPEGALAIAFGPEVDTVFRVECSLWQPLPID